MTDTDEANRKLREAWEASMRARVELVERQIEQLQRQLDALRDSLKGVCEP